MCPSRLCRVRVTCPLSQSRARVIQIFFELSHKNCRDTSSHCFASSSQCWVNETSHFSYVFICYQMAPTCHKKARDKLNKGANETCATRLCSHTFIVGWILKPGEGWIVTSSRLTPRQTNRPKIALTSMCMEVNFKCRLLGLSLLLALADFAYK